MKNKLKIMTNGLIKENPSLRLVLGTCPTLAVTTLAMNGLGMGLAATFVLIFSNMAISALRKVIPSKVRLPSYITIIAAFVTILMLLVRAYLPSLDKSLGVYLPLIVVNCIILGRAEMFASKNGVIDSALDGLGMGLGFTLTLVVMGTIREVIGNGSFFGIDLGLPIAPMTVMITPPGGFFVYGILMAAAAAIDLSKGKKPKCRNGCEDCPAAAMCGSKKENAGSNEKKQEADA